MAKKPLKVGFDLDGVILFNPVRVFRPIASAVKPLVFKKKSRDFYFPKSPAEQFLWRILHKTSLWTASGFPDLKRLSKNKNMEMYLITSRYEFLKKDFEGWVKNIKGETIFKRCIYNKNNIQPHLYKEKLIKELDLDVFVEDNWGIVSYLSENLAGTKIFWISNIFDNGIRYPYKFGSLKEAVGHLEDSYL